MKNEKSFNIVIIGSLILTLFTVVILSIPLLWGQEFEISIYILVPFSIGVISYVVFFILIQKFINNKIKLIYRIISKERIIQKPNQKDSYKIDVLDELTEQTKKWAEERKHEINQLKKQAEFRKEFLGNLAHELKTPVFSVQGYILSLLEGGLEDPKVNKDFLLRASKATDRITAILEDLDDIMSYESNRFELNLKVFDIVELTKEIVEELEYKAKEKEIQIVFKQDYNTILVSGDASRISQVITNLIANSINYGNIKGKTTIRFYEMDNAIITEISDNGIGISEKDIPRLFERFYRVEKSRARHQGGSGLGLSIAKHIIESHGHSISVRSTEGVGSSFSFSLDKS